MPDSLWIRLCKKRQYPQRKPSRPLQEPLETLCSLEPLEPLHLGAHLGPVSRERDRLAVVVVDNVVGIAFDEVNVLFERRPEIGVERSEERREK